MLTVAEIEQSVKTLLVKYNADYALLFGSYARGDATPDSDVDVVVFGGRHFKKTNIFAFSEDLRQMIGCDADVFEICEVDQSTPFFQSVLKEGIKIA